MVCETRVMERWAKGWLVPWAGQRLGRTSAGTDTGEAARGRQLPWAHVGSSKGLADACPTLPLSAWADGSGGCQNRPWLCPGTLDLKKDKRCVSVCPFPPYLELNRL